MKHAQTRSLTRRDFAVLGAAAGASLALGIAGCTPGGPSPAASSLATGEPADASSAAAGTSSSSAQPAHEATSSTAHQPQSASSAPEAAATTPAAFPIEDKMLASGYAMPALGIGTWTLSNEQAELSSYTALSCGYRLIDTAQYYGNEEGVGRAVRRAIEDGIAAREDIFVTSKIMPSSYERAAESIDESLARLDIGYIDLMLIHQPGGNDEAVWRALEEASQAGKVRSIGISNYYTPEHYDSIASIAQVPVALVQNENHPYYQNAQLKEHVEGTGGFVESWYPLGGRPGVAQMLANEVLAEIAAAHGKTPAQAILRWHLQSGFIAIPGSSNPDHIAENSQVFDFELTAEDMARIATLDGAGRFENW